MSEPEDFLTRWSRRKRATDEEKDRLAAPDATAPEQNGERGRERLTARAPANTTTPEPAFDPASLPSLDSIGAQTDISAFLKPGVPSELRLAALRRAWTMDPAIRDFEGLQENDWNFNDPNGILGFGELDPSFDLKKMLANLFGETPSAHETRPEASETVEQPAPPSHDLSVPAERAALDPIEPSTLDTKNVESNQDTVTHDSKMSQREEHIATRDENDGGDYAQVKRRRSQGSALPH